MDGQQIAPPRTVGFWGTALFPVNGMIGAGIFAMPAILVAAVGDFAPWLMLAGGMLFAPLILVFAWLAARFDHSGGPVLYGEAAFGRFIGYQAGWMRYMSAIVTVAANTHVMVAYLAALFPVLGDPVMKAGAVATIIAILTAINLFGMRKSVGALGLMTVLKLAPLGLLIVSAVFAGTNDVALALPEFSEVETVVLMLYYAFMGFETVVLPAGEMKRPKRDVPLALLTTLGAVTLLYMAIIWAFLAIGPGTGGEDNALAGAAEVSMGQFGAFAIVFAAAFSIAGNNFQGGVTLPRMTYGMAERGMLPRWFAHVSPRWQTPSNSILFYGVAGILFGLWEGFEALALAGTLTRLFTYLVSAAALPVLEQRDEKLNMLHAVIAGLAFVSTGWVATHANTQSWLTFGGLFALGTVLYFIAARQKPLEAASA
ncbi:APC family permease [Qipengyuania sp. 1NDH17]|uniref:Arginine/agmatine antiporter n=1 Tax=Qipengyuania polymorpha TaxID=2867234 RepID=A0ABS7ITS7_9SPHN|nr:APC family permease [Qipengyuania polymorpha]MBX7456757.1 APC family permease [Qipengyuania polymorpha]